MIFQKHNKRWYAVIPNYPGKPSDLEMLMGANTMLDILDKEDVGIVELEMSTSPFTNNHKKMLNVENMHNVLLKIGDNDYHHDGCTYYVDHIGGIKIGFVIWLCEATEFIFDCMPSKIYVKLKN